MKNRGALRPGAGFTLLEILVVMTLIGLAAGLVYPTVQNQLARVRTMTSAKQIAAAIQRSRLEAIRHNTSGNVRLAVRGVEAQVGDSTFFGMLSDGVEFGAPAGEPIVDGFGDSDEARFTFAGGVVEAGAFRIAGPRRSFVEIRIDPPATARVEIRKWDGTAFRSQGQGETSWKW